MPCSACSCTFFDGNGYAAAVLGSDPYADLAVFTVVNAPLHEFKPLEVVSSSTLKVGDVVVAVGNPYGLAGSMSIGIVSALGRTITEEQTGSYPIANVIQTTAPLNPGNSGGMVDNPSCKRRASRQRRIKRRNKNNRNRHTFSLP
ncbi:MAG: trypsin-like peptidase domain-containing protein [Candidatus Micrarchaeaceae archaeon]